MAPRQYGKLLIHNWRDPHWTTMTTDAQWLYQFLCSQPTTTTAGVFPLQINKWTRGSDDMTRDRIRAAATMLRERGYIVVDHDTEEGLIRNYIRDDRAGGKVFKGALSRALETQSPTLRAVLLSEIRRLDRQLDEAELAMVDALEASVSATQQLHPAPTTATPPFERPSKADQTPFEGRSTEPYEHARGPANYDGSCKKCESGLSALGPDAESDENPYWCNGCNFVLAEGKS